VTRPFISFLTDFGTDGPAPICRAVMLSIAPDAQIVDLGHSIRKYAIRDAAFLLWSAVPYLPIGVHLAVVDPGVGTDRRPIALLTGRGDRFVGPDNGLLIPATGRAGGIVEARLLENRGLWLPVTSSTFHGRDVFSPVAAHLATGVDFAEIGPSIPVSDLVQLSLPSARVHDGWLETGVVYIDAFGNAWLAGVPDDLASAVGGLSGGRQLVLEVPAGDERSAAAGILAGRVELTWQPTFGRVAVGESLLYENSSGTIAAADNQGNLAARLGLAVDQPIRIRAA